MEDKIKYSTSQLFNFTTDSYLERTSRPIYALVFLLPFIVFYELGTIFINTDALNQSQVRVVAFVWLQNALNQIGLGGKFAWAAPPLVVVVILIALQAASQKKWRFILGDIWPMAVECVLFAVPLIVLSLFLNSSTVSQPNAELSANCVTALQAEMSNGTAAQSSVLADVVTGIGAGIYEELLFRLVLICFLMIVFQDLLRFNHRNSIILAILISATLFSAHHHILFLDGRFGQVVPFDATAFVFRAFAGVYFAVLFAIRGFGVTAGAHSFYDIIATLINAYFFSR
jgi:membrane protease YdiL (CAAX protease family)